MLPILLKKMKKRLSGKKICGAGAKFYIGQSFSYFSRLSWLQYQGRKLHTITNIFYNRSINLPHDIYTSDITAKSKDGVFIVSIPKKNENIDIVVN